MTVEVEPVAVVVAAPAQNGAVNFAFDWQGADALDVRLLRNERQEQLALEYGVGWSSTPDDRATGGTVTLLADPTGWDELLVARRTTAFQPFDAPESAAGFEAALDRLAMVQQEQAAEQDKAVQLPKGLFNLSLPLAEAGKRLGWNAAADGFANYSADASDETVTAEGGTEPLSHAARAGLILTPQDFGASTASSAAVNGAAFAAWFTALRDRGWGYGFLPPGQWRVDRKFTYTQSAAGTGVNIRGAGMDVSEIVWEDTAGGGIAMTIAPNPAQGGRAAAHVSDLSLVIGKAAGGACGTALEIDAGLTATDFDGPAVTVERVAFRTDRTDCWWATGLAFPNTSRTSVAFCRFTGPSAAVYSAAVLKGVGVHYDNPGAHKLIANHWQALDTGILVSGDCEGVDSVAHVMVAVNYGVDWDAGSPPEPLLHLTGGHINAYKRCVRTDGVVQIDVFGGEYYHFLSGTITEDWAAFEFRNGRSLTMAIGGLDLGVTAAVDQNFAIIHAFDDWVITGGRVTNGNQVGRVNGAAIVVTGSFVNGKVTGMIFDGWAGPALDVTPGAGETGRNLTFQANTVRKCLMGPRIAPGVVTYSQSGNQYDDCDETLFELDSTLRAMIGAEVANFTSTAPTAGDFVIKETGVAGSYEVGPCFLTGSAPTITAAGSTIRGAHSRNSGLRASGSATIGGGGTVAVATGVVGDIRLVTALIPKDSTAAGGALYATHSGATLTITGPAGGVVDWEVVA